MVDIAKITTIASYVYNSLIGVFIFLLSFGIIGYQAPWKSVAVIVAILFPIICLTAIAMLILEIYATYRAGQADANAGKSQWKSYLAIAGGTAFPLIIYLWARFFNANSPIYGMRYVFNPYSAMGLGRDFYGEGAAPHNFLTRFYAFVISIISASLYSGIYGTGVFGNTLVKALTGYSLPHLGGELSQSYYHRFLQYRLEGTGILAKIGGFFRRMVLIGLDTPTMDMIYRAPGYNTGNSYPVNILRDIVAFVIPNWSDSRQLTFFLNWLQYASLPMIVHLFSIMI